MIKLKSSSYSIMGSRHQQNDDSVYLNEKEGIYIICDGVSEGGQGKLASELITRVIQEKLIKANEAMKNSSTKITEAKRLIAMQEVMLETFADAQSNLRAKAQNNQQYKAAATTCIAIWFSGRFAIVGHIGDSRAYLHRNGKIHQLTKDHCGLDELIKMGIPIETAKKNPIARQLTRAFGHSQFNQPDLLKIEFQPKDTLFLCTDGIYSAIENSQLMESFTQDMTSEKDMQPWVEKCSKSSGDDSTLIQIHFKLDDQFSENEPTQIGIRASDRIELIRQTPLSKYLDFSQKCHIAAICETHLVKAGTLIIREGKEGDTMYIAAKGALNFSKNDKLIRESKVGDFFGEIGLIKKLKRTATVTAKNDSVLLSISKEDLEEVFKKDPLIETRIYKAMLETVLDRFVELNEKMAKS